MQEENTLIRTQLLIGKEGLNKLRNSKVILFGVGGVGGFVAEALARAGVGKIILIDNDTVSISNLNRQIVATYDTVGKYKVDIMKDRILSINSECIVETHKAFIKESDIEGYLKQDIDYVIDAIDTVSTKLGLAEYCYKNNIKIISSMGTGNKLDPTMFKVTDIYKTKVCPLAKVMRYELRKRGVENLKVVYSEEIPLKPILDGINLDDIKGDKRQVPGSISFVPPISGIMMAGEVVRDLVGIER